MVSRKPIAASSLAAALVLTGMLVLHGCGGAGLDVSPASDPSQPGPTAAITATSASTITSTPEIALTPTHSVTVTAAVTPTGTPTPTDKPTPTETPTIALIPYAARSVKLASPPGRVWGLQFGLEFDPVRHLDDISMELPRASKAGLSSVRTTLRWDEVEPANTTPDKLKWQAADRKLGTYSRAGYDMIVQLVAYPAWATEYQCGGGLKPGMEAEWRAFVRAAAQRYSQPPYRVAAWEIGNEVDGETVIRPEDNERPPDWGRGQPTVPEGGCWGGRAAAYKEFLRMAYEEVKAVHPDIPVTLGGLAFADVNGWFDVRFLDELLAAGGGDYLDFVGYHWFANLRDVFPTTPTGPDKYRQLADIMRKHGVRKPVWLTETYRFSTTGKPETRAGQIDFLTKELVETLARSDIQRVYWYGWVDFPPSYSDAERGIVDHLHQPKPAFPVLPYVVDYTEGHAEDISTDRVIAFRFLKPRAAGQTIIAWSKDGQPARFEVPARSNKPAAATFFPKDMLMAGQCCGKASVPPANGKYAFDLGADAVFISIDRE